MIVSILYGLAMAVLTLYGVNMLWLAFQSAKISRKLPGPVPPAETPESPLTEPFPEVTIQLPLYNEAYVAERLLDACAAIEYPKDRLEIQVLDDSTDETVDIVGARVEYWRSRGVDMVHVRRNNRDGFKAGALQNGLKIARGSFIAIFDADFIPPPNFLQRTIPLFTQDRVGMVQTRWGHINEEDSILTKIQGASLDAHFAVEQLVRNRTKCFMNFNGTAGVWNAQCIEDAGGWEGDTLTEDLDLSYRAQLRGWEFKFAPEIEVPAELPGDINALRAQQFRWTKGAAETTRKVIASLWRSKEPLRVKLEGTAHLTNHIVFPFVLLVAACHAPLLLLRSQGDGPGDLYFAVMGMGLLAFFGVFLVQVYAQRSLYPDWPRRLLRFPFFMAGSMGFALNNSRAVIEAFIGKRSPFVRTPKVSAEANLETGSRSWWKSKYAQVKWRPIVWLELLLTIYSAVGLGIVLYAQEWAAVPFQALFLLGFGMMSGLNIVQVVKARRLISQEIAVA